MNWTRVSNNRYMGIWNMHFTVKKKCIQLMFGQRTGSLGKIMKLDT